MPPRYATRKDDKRVLEWVKDRSAGQSARQIAKKHGGSPGAIIKATNAVLAADREESGENVAGKYWGGK